MKAYRIIWKKSRRHHGCHTWIRWANSPRKAEFGVLAALERAGYPDPIIEKVEEAR